MASSRGTVFRVSSSLAGSADEITRSISEYVCVDAVWIAFRENLSEPVPMRFRSCAVPAASQLCVRPRLRLAAGGCAYWEARARQAEMLMALLADSLKRIKPSARSAVTD